MAGTAKANGSRVGAYVGFLFKWRWLVLIGTLGIGFLMNLFSVMDGQKSFGGLAAGVIAAALVADFLLMPALILSLKPFGAEKASNGPGKVR